jgi:hypothetical protein
LVAVYTHIYDFLLNVPPLKCRQADIVTTVSSPMSLLPVATTPVIIYRGVIDTSKQLITSVVDNGDKHKVANISLNFRKNLQWPLWNIQGPGGN